MNNFSGIKDLLDNHGIPYQEFPNYLKCVANWRDGQDVKSVTIYEDLVIDHVAGEKFSYESLISKITGIEDKEKLKTYLEGKNFVQKKPELVAPLINGQKVISPDFLKELSPNYSYWNKRGISDKTLIENTGGTKGRRYWFIIRNSKGQIVGKTGRDITGKSDIKWLHKLQKTKWVYNAFLNGKEILQKKEVFIVESIGDYLALYECGIKNVIVIFGIEMSLAVLNYLLRVNPNKIYICLNDDSKKNSVGNEASEKLGRRLRKYFDARQIKVHNNFFGCNDLNDLLIMGDKAKVLEWYNSRESI